MKKTIGSEPVKLQRHHYSIIQSPVGSLMLLADDSVLMGLYFAETAPPQLPRQDWTENAQHPVLQRAAKQLKEYFKKKRTSFSLPLAFKGTNFQRNIWREIARIPYGKTISYSELAERAGAPRAVRAAGTSTGRNPLAIIIPCHRVVGKDGSMCGFGGGLERKQFLLELESRT